MKLQYASCGKNCICYKNYKNSRNKKAQFKIQQMAFMLLAVFLFFILVSMIWFAIQYRNIHKQAGQLEEEKANLMAGFLYSNSEFSCGSYCIDTDRAMVLMSRTAYSEFWPVAYIKLRKIGAGEDIVCDKANYPKCKILNIYENKEIESSRTADSFVALCRYEKTGDYLEKICELGKFMIGYEVK